jgi:hypothetical protein
MRSLASLAALLLVPTLAAPAFAQPTPPDAKPDVGAKALAEAAAKREKETAEKAAELQKRGLELAQKEQCEVALTPLTASWGLKKDPVTAAALGTCEAKMKRYRAAAEHLVFALRAMQEGEERKKLEAHYNEARAKVGGIRINSNIEGADVFAGDQLAGQTPLEGEVFVDPGEALIVVKKAGYEESRNVVNVGAHGALVLDVTLKPAGEGSETRYAARNRTKIPIFVLGGAALVTAAVGAGFYVSAIGKGSEADTLLDTLTASNPTPCKTTSADCEKLLALRKSHDSRFNTGTGVMIGAGALATAAVIYAVWALGAGGSDEKRTAWSTAPLSLAPSVGPTGGGLSMSGSF